MKNKSILLLISSALLVSCSADPKRIATADISKSQSVQDPCYTGFINEMSSLVPENAYHCGIFGNPKSNPTVPCAKAAVKSGQPFIFGYQSWGDDSKYCHAAAKEADGQLLSIFYDAGMIGTGNKYAFIQISRCKKIEFKLGTIGIGSFFDTSECSDADDLVDAIIKARNPK